MKNIDKYISRYFFIAQKIVKEKNPNAVVVLQFFQKKDFAILSGIEEVLSFLQDNLKNKITKIRYLPEGSSILNKEVVLELEGNYQDFGLFEGIIDGILSRWTSISTNSYLCLKAANKKSVIAMSDRSDHYLNQEIDGKAMYIGGLRGFSSDIQVPAGATDCTVYGSIPHALIQNFKGDVTTCMEHYQKLFPQDELIGLVDYHNDVISDSLKLWHHFGNDLKGVRVDTSVNIRDYMFGNDDSPDNYGVCINQIKRLRKSLDGVGGNNVKIFISSGLTPEKIEEFEKANSPIDGYGVGEFLLKINNTFCGDATLLNNEPCSKVGRSYSQNIKLVEYRWK